jgi:exopolyphosphatase/guanosine-5'-triphosphate,3'-diphosphate pyrophosphatase
MGPATGPFYLIMLRFIELFHNQKHIAAIDLGSNALRAVIAREGKNSLEIIRTFRAPLRLGEDVFQSGKISPQKMQETEEAFIKLFHFFTEYNVENIRAVATSAMRDSKNGRELARRIFKTTGIEIETIAGMEEAEIIFKAVKGQIPLSKKTAVLMDIGGGSTEITIVKNDKIIGIHSFNVGTVRLLQYKNQEELEGKISDQVKEIVTFVRGHLGKKKPNLLIGTGGNLRRIGKIRKKILGRETSQLASFDEIHHMEEAILSMSYVDRIRRLELDQNRADVILPAIMLTHHLMQKLKLKEIRLPKVGLKEGLVLSMLPKEPKSFILKD